MTIRTFQPGDEASQVSIYNEAGAELPKFKPATLDEVRRRCRAADFDPQTRFYALADGQPVAYATFQVNGRVSFPWCRQVHTSWAEPLLRAVLDAMRARGLKRAFAAYREDWTAQQAFFAGQGFQKARDMVNFVVDLADMPTPAAGRSSTLTPLRPTDLPALVSLLPEALRTTSLTELERHFFQNPYFRPESLFAQRDRSSGSLLAVGMAIINPAYANPRQLDAAMPCYRLGAFGTEGMTTKRIHGLFSFLARPTDVNRLGLDLLGHAGFQLQQRNGETIAAQVPSDVPSLLRFYQNHFRRQGHFPVLERVL
jgi:hypothetical protein